MKPVKYGENLKVSAIRQSPFHFRKETADQKLDDLAASIREIGLVHAISVVRHGDHDELINGHRRLLAHRLAGIDTIRANIYEYEPEELADESRKQQAIVQFLLAANSAEPLIPLERARYYEEAMEKFGWTPAHIAQVHHVTEEAVLDDLLFLNIDEKVLDLVEAHPDTFTQEHLRVLAEFSSPSARKAWAMTPEEQIQVAEALAHQRDKRLIESTRALQSHIKEIVKTRRDERKAERKRLGGGGEDPVKALYKLLDATQKAVGRLTATDLSPILEIDLRDKGRAYQDVLAMAQQLMEFAEGPVQVLPVRKPRPTSDVVQEPVEAAA